MSGYRPGLTIANGSSVTFQCDNDFNRSTTQQVLCALGELAPQKPNCKTEDNNVTIDAPHFLGGSDIVKGGDISVIEYSQLSGKYCGPPAK